MYRGIELTAIYSMEPYRLEPLFHGWEQQWKTKGGDLNNPKIPAKFVLEHGTRIHGEVPERIGRGKRGPAKPPIDPFEPED